MCDPLVGCRSSVLCAPGKRTIDLFWRWRHRHDFPSAQWRNLLGQTLARCVALCKQVDRHVAELRAEAAEYLQSGLLDRADDKVARASMQHKLYLAYILIQGYCEQAINHLVEIEDCEKKECPLEVREAISSLLYVMPRCEELIELRQLKPLISSKFGKSFVSEVAEHSIQCAVDKKDKRNRSINVLASSSLRSSSIQSFRQSSYRKDHETNHKEGENNALRSSSLRKSFTGKTIVPSSSGKGSSQPMHEPSYKKLYEVKLLNPIKLEPKESRVQIKNKKVEHAEPTSGMQVAIQHASNATCATQGALELSKLPVSSDSSDTDEDGGPIDFCRRPSRVVEFEEVEARLIALKKKKQHRL